MQTPGSVQICKRFSLVYVDLHNLKAETLSNVLLFMSVSKVKKNYVHINYSFEVKEHLEGMFCLINLPYLSTYSNVLKCLICTAISLLTDGHTSEKPRVSNLSHY
jgi:hypothetical protein